MQSNKFRSFLKNLGFSESDFGTEGGSAFNYQLPIGSVATETIKYIYTPTSEDIFGFHQRFWNKNDTNNFIAIGDNTTHVIDVKTKPDKQRPLDSKIKSFDYGVNSEGFEKEKVKEITKDFIDSTYFFDFVIKNKRRKHDEVDKDLLLNLIALRNDLVEIKDDEETIHLLILRCLFIKYLEDKGIYDKGYLTESINSEEPAKLIVAFEEIKKINGDIFKFDRQVLENQIDSKYLDNLSRFFTSDYRSGQTYLFPYLFDQIPIQLISNVYEAFLNNDKKQGKGIYYTPPFLVNFILSHSLKEKLKVKSDVTVFDPAVGSASFLVESFKAIVKPDDDFEKKKSILENQLFGVDVDENALPIAAFSLYLALIETESPEFIREQIKISNPILPSLIGKSLICANTLADDVFKDKTFDCIVSNPPWGSVELNEDKENIKERNAIRTKGKKGTMPEYKNVSDYERSQAFLVRVKKWCNEDTICSLVVKNSIFLNDNSEDFRKELLKNYQLNYFYELSNYNKILFKKQKIGEINGETIETGATEPCAVVVFELPKLESNKVKYISPKLNDFSENFQIIHYTQKDINEVEQNRFIEDDLLWRILVNGDFEDYKLIKKLQNQFTKTKVICSRGFEPKKDAISTLNPNYRTYIQSSYFERYNINCFSEWDWNLPRRKGRNGNELLFNAGGKILIAYRPTTKDQLRLRAAFTEKEIVYRDDIIGFKVESNENQSAYLGVINSSLAGYFLYNSSSHWFGGLKRDSIRLSDLRQFPYPNLNQESIVIENTISQKIHEIQIFKQEITKTKIKENEIDELVFDLYGLKEYEKEIVREFYQINVERAEKNEKFVRSSDIEIYAKKFAEVFGLLLEENSKLVATKYHTANVGTAICFTIIDKYKEAKLEEDKTLEILHFVKKKQIGQADVSKILNEEKIKIYDGKLMYIVKSNLFKDWTTRQAIKDANEEIGLLLSQLPTTNE